MFHHLSIPYIGKTDLSVKKPSARTLKGSLEQLTKSQLDRICKERRACGISVLSNNCNLQAFFHV